jgi:hypothetical protein
MITLPETATLTVTAQDDGIPKPRPRAKTLAASADTNVPSEPPRRDRGVQVKWIVYRGPGKVKFDPDTSAYSYGKPVTLSSKVSFGAPGTYVLQAIASDGQLTSTHNVTVTVNPAKH